jgi:hypothetical protein
LLRYCCDVTEMCINQVYATTKFLISGSIQSTWHSYIGDARICNTAFCMDRTLPPEMCKYLYNILEYCHGKVEFSILIRHSYLHIGMSYRCVQHDVVCRRHVRHHVRQDCGSSHLCAEQACDHYQSEYWQRSYGPRICICVLALIRMLAMRGSSEVDHHAENGNAIKYRAVAEVTWT